MHIKGILYKIGGINYIHYSINYEPIKIILTSRMAEKFISNND